MAGIDFLWVGEGCGGVIRLGGDEFAEWFSGEGLEAAFLRLLNSLCILLNF